MLLTIALSLLAQSQAGVQGGGISKADVLNHAASERPKRAAHFVGSESCKGCHAKTYTGWKQTRMANVVRDPRVHADSVLGDFAHPDPVRTFGLDEVALVYGSRYKQRYFTKRGDDYFPLPAQWDIAKKQWLPYHIEAGTDWWVPFYGPNNLDRPTGPTCDGCHSVNYDVETKQVTEWNVGCEKCHGPGQRACGASNANEHREPGRTRLRPK